MANADIRRRLQHKEFIVAPGVFDMISALVADRMNFPALYVTGYGTVASALGLPDVGLATYTDMVEHIRRIAQLTKTPIIADGDTGYGGLINVAFTVRGYENAGVTAIQLEDQEFPKRCGHTPHRRVVPLEEMVRKIQVACDSRSSADFLIIARTDARTGLGLDEALRRSEAYSNAGADVIFVESPETEQELKTIVQRIDKPVVANLVPGGRTPLISSQRLAEIGYSIAIYPVVALFAATLATMRAYQDLQEHGQSTGLVPSLDFASFNELIGFDAIKEFEKRFSEG